MERNIADIPYDMKEKQRWLLANAMVVAHKKANKSAALQQINLCKTNEHHEKPLR